MALRQEKVMSGTGKTRGRGVLTAKAIESLKPDVEPYRVADLRAAGLAIRVALSGLKSWDVAYRIAKSTMVKRAALWRSRYRTRAFSRQRVDQRRSSRAGSHCR
jgi:hypothetical protein